MSNLVYIDPPNTDLIINTIKFQTHNELVLTVNKIFPSWIIGKFSKWCDDYPFIGTRIILVDFIPPVINLSYHLIQVFCKLFALSGFSVICKDSFTKCKICDSILPTPATYSKINKLTKSNIPPYWSSKCARCKPTVCTE